MPGKWNIVLTLKTHKTRDMPPGFNPETQSMELTTVKYGDKLSQVIQLINQWRGPDAQITKLYNSMGQEIDVSIWSDLVMQDHLTLYVDPK